MMWLLNGPLKNFDNKVKNVGFNKAILGLLKNTGTKLEIEGKENIKENLQKDGIIIVANHPAETDVPALLATLEQRKDVYLIINSMFVGLLKNMDKHLIPVYVTHGFKESKFDIKERLFFWMTGKKILSKEESQIKNKVSLKKAGKILRNGGVVIIYPGPNLKDGRWFPGVGYLIDEAKSNKKIKVLMAHIEGTSKWDYIRLVPGVAKLMPNFRVTFSNFLNISEVWQNEAKKTAWYLESVYKNWEMGIEKMKIEKIYWKVPNWSMAVVRSMIFWISARL
jgi:hypothetical protein